MSITCQTCAQHMHCTCAMSHMQPMRRTSTQASTGRSICRSTGGPCAQHRRPMCDVHGLYTGNPQQPKAECALVYIPCTHCCTKHTSPAQHILTHRPAHMAAHWQHSPTHTPAPTVHTLCTVPALAAHRHSTHTHTLCICSAHTQHTAHTPSTSCAHT